MNAETPVPRYLEIRRTLEAAIVSGAWQPGHKLPSEPVLAAEFGCARMTMGRAIGLLVEAGLLVRRRRAGTFVAAPRTEETVLEIHDIAAEVRAGGRRYDFDRRSRRIRTAGAADAERLGVETGAPVLWIRGVHRADGAAIALEERLINLDAAPQAEAEPFTDTAPGSWLLVHAPWTEAEHHIEAVNADEDSQVQLGLEPAAACLRVERRTWRGPVSITWVRLTFPGDRRRLVGRFRPPTASRRPAG